MERRFGLEQYFYIGVSSCVPKTTTAKRRQVYVLTDLILGAITQLEADLQECIPYLPTVHSSLSFPSRFSMPGSSTPSCSKPRILELADRISHSAAHLDSILRAKDVPSPSFAEDAPAPYPSETDDVRDVIVDAAAELYDLLLEPMALLYKKTGVRFAPRTPQTMS